MIQSDAAQATTPVAPTRLGLPDLISEALTGVTLRPARTVLTALGSVLGVGAMVAVLGLTATSAGQISDAFDVWVATEASATDAGVSGKDTPVGTVYSFPADTEDRVSQLAGAESAGVGWQVAGISSPRPQLTTSLDPRSPPLEVDVRAASPGYLLAAEPSYRSGRGFNAFTRRLDVVVLGRSIARSLGITSVERQPVVFVNGIRYTVIGILSDVKRDPALLGAVIVPDLTALNRYGPPSDTAPARLLVATRLGAAQQVSATIAQAVRPDRPDLLRVEPVAQPTVVEGAVSGTLNALFLSLAGVTLLIGAASIANITLVSVLERAGEIGLRRALGARRRHIALQFLAESGIVGGLGGLIGTALGNVAVLLIAIANQWTALLDPRVTALGPLIGLVVGVLAGLYPSIRAASVQPADAVRK